MRTLRIYGALVRAGLRTEAQYRANLVVMLLGGAAYQGVGLAFIGIVVARVGEIGGWGLSEIALLYGIRLTAHGLWVFPFSELIQIDEIIRRGEFDRYLIRPVNVLVQVITRRVALMQLGDLLGGVVLLGYACVTVDIDWTPALVAFLPAAVVGGALVEGAIHLTVAATAFRTLSTRSLRVALDSTFNTFGSYPMAIFPGALRFALTFVLPLAFVAYFPATVLLGRTDELMVPAWPACAAPVVGGALFWLAYRFWVRQSRHYQSSGT